MKHQCFVLFFCVLLFGSTMLFASSNSILPATPNGFGDTEIKKTFVITMKPCDPICIDGSVVLSCPDTIENILAYKWIDKSTGLTVGTTKSIVVSPKNTTEYELRVTFIRKSDERIKNWNFEKGNPTSSWNAESYLQFHSEHSYVKNTGNTALWDEGKYAIGKNPRSYHMNFESIGDHTTGTGYMMIINGAPGKDVVIWEQTITNILPGNQYAFVMWGRALTPDNPAVLRFSINGDGNALDKFPLENTSAWQQFYRIWTAPAGNYSSIKISLLNNVTERSGNDFAIDDFSFSPVEEAIGNIEVKVLPEIEVARLENSEVCEGADLNIQAVLAAGSEITKYEWYKGSNLLSNRNLLAIQKADAMRDGGSYLCKVTGVCGADSVTFNLAVRDTLKVKTLNDIKACKDKPVSWYAEVIAGYKPVYEWSAPVGVSVARWSGKNTNTYTKKAVDLTDQGVYTCTVSNMCGVKKVSAELKVAEELQIVKISPDDTVCVGESVKFGVQTNLDNVTVQWWKPDGSYQMSDTLSILSVQELHRGKYICEVTSTECGVSRIAEIYLDVYERPTTLSVSGSQTLCVGENVTLAATVSGKGLKYQWEGPNGYRSDRSAVELLNVRDQYAGIYKVTVTDVCGVVQSANTSLAIRKPAGGLKIPLDTYACAGSAVMFEITGGGDGLDYVWTKPNGNKAYGKTININNISIGDIGSYACRVTGACSTDTTLRTTLNLYPFMTVIGNEGIFRKCAGESVDFHVNAVGRGVSYSWYKNGNRLANTAAALSLTDIAASDAATYSCVVTDFCGTTCTLTYVLELKVPTAIVSHSSDKELALHEALRLFVRATGENLTYTWKQNGVVIPGSSELLALPGFSVVGDYVFSCVVKGDCGQQEVFIRVHVGEYNVIQENKTEQLCENRDYSCKLSVLPSGCTDASNLSYAWIYNTDTISRSAVLELKNLTLAHAGLYKGCVIGSCGVAIVNLNIVVKELPVIGGFVNNNVPVSDTIILCGEENARIAPVIIKGDVSTVEWRREGVLISNGTELVINNASIEQDYGHYECRVNTECGEAVGKFVVVVRRKLKIVDHPSQVNACIGDSVVLNITASGYNERYTWSGPGTGWESPRVNVYRKKVLDLRDAGTYSCTVSSSCGTETVHTLVTIEKEMTITSVAPNLIVCRGRNIEMYVTANQEAVEYSWKLPNGSVRNENRFSVMVTAADTGWYAYTVKGKCISKTGRVHVGMYSDMGELTITGNTEVCEHGSAAFQAKVKGDGLIYRWMGPDKFTANVADITIPDVTVARTGKYELSVSDACGANRTGNIVLNLVKDVKSLSLNTTDTTVCPGSEVVFEVRGGTPGVVYNWKYKGVLLGNGSRLILRNLKPEQAGEYSCEVVGACETKILKTKLSLYKQLTANGGGVVRTCPDDDAEFVAAVEGSKVTYQWIKNGQSVAYGSAVYNIAEAIPSDTGIYECKITSACGDTILKYELQLKEKTRIKTTSPDKFVCEYDATFLTVEASGENNQFKWWQNNVLLNETSNILSVLNVGTTDTIIYTCAVQGECEADTASIYIKVGAFKPMEGGTDTLCQGSNYTYNMDVMPVYCYGNERFEYRWYRVGGDTLSRESILKFTDISFADEGRYACHVYEECGDTIVYLNIKVMAPPKIISITEDSYVVEGGSHTIKVMAEGGKLTYTWSKVQESLPYICNEFILNPVEFADEGTYRVTVENQCGHVDGQTTLSVWHQTVVTSPQERDYAVCPGDSIRFSVEAEGEPGLIYQWYRAGQLLPVPFVSELFIDKVTGSNTGVYWCIVSGKGGADSCRINLDVLPLPQISIVGETELCINDTERIYLGTSDEGRVTWKWDVTGGILTRYDDRPEATIRWTGKDTAVAGLTVTSLTTGCVNRVEQEIRFKQLPDLNLAAPELVGNCIDSLLLDFAYPSGGYYMWEGVQTDRIYFGDKNIGYAVSYYFTDNMTSCSDHTTATIHIDEAPYITITNDSIITGECRPVRLKADKHSEGAITWSPEIWLDAANSPEPLFIPGETQSYTATLKDRYGCEAFDQLHVTVMKSPEVQVMSDTVIGECNNITLSAHYYSPYFKELHWSPSDFLKVNADHTADVLKKGIGDNLFVVTVSDNFECSVSDTVKVTVKAVDGFEDRRVCGGDAVTVDCGRFTGFVWFDGYEEPLRTLTKAGEYYLKTIDVFGCEKETVFEVNPIPAVTLVDTFVFEEETYVYELHPDPAYGPYNIRWHDGSVSPVYSTKEEGFYSVTVIDNNGCAASDTAYLEVKKRAIIAPNAFIPGSGGENSKFYLKEINFVGNFEMYIYDRWGELVYKTNQIGMNGGWDGSFSGMECQGGAYVWVAYSDGKLLGRGTVVLVK